MKANKNLEFVNHGDIIEGCLWGHQICHIFLNEKYAKKVVEGMCIDPERISLMKVGQILVSTLHGQLAGLIKDHANRFRFIKFPE